MVKPEKFGDLHLVYHFTVPLMSFSLDIRAWSTETQTDVALILYKGVLTHSAPLVSLYTHWKYLKLSFFDFPGGYRKRHEVGLKTLKSTRSKMFFRIGVLKNFVIFKGKTTELESPFNKVADLQAYKFIEKRLQLRCFPLNIAKSLRTAFFIEHLWWLLLDPVTHLLWSFFCANNLLFIL